MSNEKRAPGENEGPNDNVNLQGDISIRVDLDENEIATSASPEGAAGNSRTEIISAPALMEKNIRPLVWVAGKLAPEGLVILAGKPKMGKSMMALDLGIAVASGNQALGSFQVDRGTVLYLALEDGERRLQDRLKRLLAGNVAPNDLHFVTDWRRMDQGGLAYLDAWLHSHPKARLVIIDTLARFRPPSKKRSDVYLEDYGVAAELKRLADKHHVAILLIHHLRKEPGLDPLDEISGSTGLTGAADTILIMKRARTDQSAARLFVTGRDVEEVELALRSDPKSKRWFSAGAAADVDISSERKAIIDVLRNARRPLGPSEVATMLGKDVNSVKQLMFKMTKDRQLIHRDGRYEAHNPDNR